ncbi:hypothetical protein ACP70R_007576 [Stipagrostis hirtigluma subsp. patula]
MDLVTGALGALLTKLGDLLTGEYQLQTSVRDDIAYLMAELESMEAALLKISESPIDHPPDKQHKLWARDVRELSYDIEDRVDTFMVRIDNHAPKEFQGFRGFIDRGLDLLRRAKIRHDIGTDIKSIKRRIQEVSDRRVRYKVDGAAEKLPVGPTVDSLRQSALYKRVTELVGVKDKSNDLVRWLMEGGQVSDQQELKIVSIVGFGGIGKTTLAKLVYDKLKGQFNCGAFVSMSFNPNMITIFCDMLYQLSKDYQLSRHNWEATFWGEPQLINEITEFLHDKRYFIVIDDIWHNSVWEKIRCALIKNKCGSRIITTTRKFDVAKQTGDIYHLKPLSSVDSRKLFCLRIFGTEDKCLPNALAAVSNSILKKCGGVPLAIITIASMLASKKGLGNVHKYWSQVCQSMGSGLEDSSNVMDMRRILSVSYYDLPLHLKTCLLYLCSYPEDYEISTQDLISKWLGEGFILKEQGKTMYEVGEDYVCELINRSLVQQANVDDKYQHKNTFRIHDMVLDLITWLSNQNDFLILHGHERPIHLPNKIRRLSFQNGIEDDSKKLPTMKCSYVRSIFVFNGGFHMPPTLSSFPVLRVLDLAVCDKVDNHHFKDICNMLHLRCLILNNTCITEIPQEIGNLKLLQSLDIGSIDVQSLPSSFVQLQQLVLFKFGRIECSIPEGFGNLKSLEQLTGTIWITSVTEVLFLGALTELERVQLYISGWNKSFDKPVLQWLSAMINLKYLFLRGSGIMDLGSSCDKLVQGLQQLRVIHMEATICTVPKWMCLLSSLSILSLVISVLTEEDLRVLGSIPSLYDLAISRNGACPLIEDKKLVISNVYPFLCLTSLTIREIPIVFAQGAMPKLQNIWLRIDEHKMMDKFGNLDFSLENLPSLERVDVWLNHQEDAAKDAIRNAVNMHPNKPTLGF